MSRHRVCCCDQGQGPCSTVVTYYDCQSDVGSPASLTGPTNDQIFVYQSDVYIEQISGRNVVVQANFQDRGIAGVAIGNSGPFPADDIRQRYGTDAFGSLVNPRTLFFPGGGVGFQFYAGSVSGFGGPFATVNPISVAFTTPEGFLSIAAQHAQFGTYSCSTLGDPPNVDANTVVGSERIVRRTRILTQVVDGFTGETATAREEVTTTFTRVVGFTDYLDSYTGPRTLCQGPAPSTAPGNDAMIEAMLAADPLRNCRTCGP